MRGYSGRLAGVTFEDGRPAEGQDPPSDIEAFAQSLGGYAKRHGLTIDDDGRLVIREEGDPPPPDPRDIGTDGDGRTRIGTDLRDAAVDPRPEDFLPPTNAGEPGQLGNPHGPTVIAPEIHGSQGVRPVKGGPVHSGDLQQEQETAHAVAFSAELEPPAGVSTRSLPDRPANGDKVAVWRDYATAVDPDAADEIASTKKDDLIDRYGSADAVEQLVDPGESGSPVGTEVPGDDLGPDGDQLAPGEGSSPGEKVGDDKAHKG